MLSLWISAALSLSLSLSAVKHSLLCSASLAPWRRRACWGRSFPGQWMWREFYQVQQWQHSVLDWCQRMPRMPWHVRCSSARKHPGRDEPWGRGQTAPHPRLHGSQNPEGRSPAERSPYRLRERERMRINTHNSSACSVWSIKMSVSYWCRRYGCLDACCWLFCVPVRFRTSELCRVTSPWQRLETFLRDESYNE